MRKLAAHDNRHMSPVLLHHICNISGIAFDIIPLALINYKAYENIPGCKSLGRKSQWISVIRQNDLLAHTLKYILVNLVKNKPAKRLNKLFDITVNETGKFPECFVDPTKQLTYVLAKMSQEHLAPFSRHVHTSLQANIKTLKRLKVPEKVDALVKTIYLKQQAMAVVLKALAEGDLKKEISEFYVNTEFYTNLKALAREKAEAYTQKWGARLQELMAQHPALFARV